MNRLATSLTLLLSIVPSALCFIVNTHLQATSFSSWYWFLSISKRNYIYISFLLKAFISSTIASFHLGPLTASFQPRGIQTKDRNEIKAQYEEDNESYETDLDIRCWIQVLTPFQRAIRRLESLSSKAFLTEVSIVELLLESWIRGSTTGGKDDNCLGGTLEVVLSNAVNRSWDSSNSTAHQCETQASPQHQPLPLTQTPRQHNLHPPLPHHK